MVTKEEWAALDQKLKSWLDWRGKKELEKAALKCPKCESSEVYGKEGERCCLACGAHQSPRS